MFLIPESERLRSLRPVYIYAIICPATQTYVYIGQTLQHGHRFKQHFWNRESLIGMWCRAMKSIGLGPTLKIIDVTYGNYKALEDIYIRYYKSLNQANHNRFHRGGRNSVRLYLDDRYRPQKEEKDIFINYPKFI